MILLTAPHHGRRAAVLIATLSAGLALAGCGATEEDPLGVNSAGEDSPAVAAGTAGEGDSSSADPIGLAQGEDPLGIGLDGAALCGVQPKDSRLHYTVMLHNPTLESFTFGEMTLGDPEELVILSSQAQTANREGHHHGGTAKGGHDAHAAVPTPTASPEPIGPPVDAEGYVFEPDAHVNIIVTVELAEGAPHGSAENIVVAFSSPERDYAVAHPLKIDVDAVSCA
ncbi:hypothetical protein E8P82_07190 [Arthrobacter echini]|uniref:Copper chaperone PCu(A)C n=1 Tax=Arthrobacter echini TaxID=1529066 RepID=A0A4S5E5K4_9MICC|nr:hypothetical protein [Arthrobacter echini]THJ66720.1 hypothetical protein E8P82_07190 [Arthrobacter echini]